MVMIVMHGHLLLDPDLICTPDHNAAMQSYISGTEYQVALNFVLVTVRYSRAPSPPDDLCIKQQECCK